MHNTLSHNAIIFYTLCQKGCGITPPEEEDILAIAEQVKAVTIYAHGLFTLLQDLTVERVAEICGLSTEEATAIKDLAALGHDITHIINRSFVGLRDVLQCETFNPIYTTFIYNAFCVEGVTGLTYIFATTLVIAVLSMVMIMFRAALYPIKDSVSVPGPGGEGAVLAESYNDVMGYNENSGEKKPVESSQGGGEDEAEAPVIY